MKHLFLFLALLVAAPAWAQDDSPKVQARLVAEDTAVAPGGGITIALEELIAPEWHTYWKNPGDSGLPTQLQWQLPSGWSAGETHWPTPDKIRVGEQCRLEWDIRADASDDKTVQGFAHFGNSIVAVCAMNNQLGNHGVVEHGDLAAILYASVYAHAQQVLRVGLEHGLHWRLKTHQATC